MYKRLYCRGAFAERRAGMMIERVYCPFFIKTFLYGYLFAMEYFWLLLSSCDVA